MISNLQTMNDYLLADVVWDVPGNAGVPGVPPTRLGMLLRPPYSSNTNNLDKNNLNLDYDKYHFLPLPTQSICT